MFTKLFNHFPGKIALFLILIFTINQCGLYKKTDARKTPTNAKERVKKNLEEGRRIKFGQLGGRGGSGNFEFASSNEMWRATVDILDFMPLANADYGGGVIITDWYNEGNKKNESIKIMVQFLSNEIRADAVDVTIFEKICENTNCKTNKIQSKLEKEIKLAILKKAAIMEKEGFQSYYEKVGKNKAVILEKKE